VAQRAKIYTKTGDDGTTGRLFGGRVPKTDPSVELLGAVDEAQAALGLARAEAGADGAVLRPVLAGLEHDLYVLMAEVSCDVANRRKLEPGRSLVTGDMVLALEAKIDEVAAEVDLPAGFVIPGGNRLSAALDFARTVVRRAERAAAAAADGLPGSLVPVYLNRLSDLCYMLARQAEAEQLMSRPSGAGHTD
jgi:cob(I)alamin adenosyltransferase